MPDLDLSGLPFAVKIDDRGRTDPGAASATSSAVGAARSLWNTAKRAAEGAGVPHATRSTRLADGTFVKATVSGDVSVVLIILPPFAGGGPNPKYVPPEPEPRFYVESAWIDKPTLGNVSDARSPGINSVSTGAVAGIQAQVKAFFNDLVGVENKNVAFRLVTNPDLFDTPEEYNAFVIEQTANVNNKLAARYAAHYVTGLLRCFIRGKLGRRLQEEGFSSGFPSVKSCAIGNWTLALESDCIFAAPTCFVYVRKATDSFSVWYMTLPEELAPYYGSFYALSNGRFKRAVATVLLAYATVRNVTATAFVPAQPVTVSVTFDDSSPLWGGWRHSYWSGKACWTNTIGNDASNRLNMVTREATFSIAADAGVIQGEPPDAPFYNTPISVSTAQIASGYYAIPNATRVWYPLTAATSWIIRDADPGATAPMDASAPMWAFYDDNDSLVQCTVGMPTPPIQFNESSQNYGLGCGFGAAGFNSRTFTGARSSINCVVSGGVTLSGGTEPQEIILSGTVSAGGGSATEPGNSGASGSWVDTGCAGEATGNGDAYVSFLGISAASISATQTAVSSSSAPALVVPYCGDGAFSLMTSTFSDVVTVTNSVRDFSANAGRVWSDNPNTAGTGSGIVYSSWDSAGPFGALRAGGDTVTDNSSTSEVMHVRTPFGSEEIAISESNGIVWSTPAFSNMDAAFYVVSDFSGATRIAALSDYQINNAPGGFPVGFQ